jgi:hypothetical protein
VAHPWHPGHDTTLTPANPWTDRPMCIATLPGHRRATHARIGGVRPLPGHLRRPGGTVGVVADERFTAVLNSITKAAAVQCRVPHPPTDRGGGDRRPRAEGGVHEEVS